MRKRHAWLRRIQGSNPCASNQYSQVIWCFLSQQVHACAVGQSLRHSYSSPSTTSQGQSCRRLASAALCVNPSFELARINGFLGMRQELCLLISGLLNYYPQRSRSLPHVINVIRVLSRSYLRSVMLALAQVARSLSLDSLVCGTGTHDKCRR